LPSAGRSGGGTTTVAGSVPGTPRGATAHGYDGAAALARVGEDLAVLDEFAVGLAGAWGSSIVVGGPADGVEYGDGIEVVAPVCDLAIVDRDDGDEVVVVGVPGADRSAVDGILEDDD
jgi:hypothetical protein